MKIISVLVILLVIFLAPSSVLAVDGSTFDTIANNIGLKLQGSLGDIVSAFLPVFFPIAGMVVFLYLIYGGYEIMLSGGDPKKAAAGKTIITNALVGFLILFLAYWIVRAIGVMLGSPEIKAPFGG